MILFIVLKIKEISVFKQYKFFNRNKTTKMKNNIIMLLRNIARLLVALVFLFSGIVKGIDPLGSAYKFGDYFVALNLSFLQDLALPLSIMMNAAEFLIGFALLLNLRTRFAAWMLLVFMSFFTLLTLYVAIANPVSDCGCFGDAVKLSNWGTFYKNVVLMLLTLFIFFQRKYFKSLLSTISQWLLASIAAVMFVYFSAGSLQHLPIYDFRPYKVGKNITEQTIIPEGALQDEYQTLLFYQKDGVTKEFTLENYPWEDSTWIFVETKSKLIKEGYKPPIHDFSFRSLDGNDVTDLILNDPNFSFFICAYNLNKANSDGLKKLNSLFRYAKKNNLNFFFVTASAESTIEKVKKDLQLEYDFYLGDETAIKTIIRANPGVLMLRQGTVYAKWNANSLPDLNSIDPEKLDVLALTQLKNNVQQFNLLFYLAVFVIIIFGAYRYLKSKV